MSQEWMTPEFKKEALEWARKDYRKGHTFDVFTESLNYSYLETCSKLELILFVNQCSKLLEQREIFGDLVWEKLAKEKEKENENKK
jgi:hypothetical protein